MFARWASLGIGIWLLLAPVVLGYHHVGPVLHDVALGLLVSITTLAALEWPRARFAQLAPAAWLLWAPRLVAGSDPMASATELAAGLALLALCAIPSAPLHPVGTAKAQA